jgi:undecaprenyldiphospho-muramoylpentapeptide beta-N-acetylglucosaminyltransferase
VTDSTAPLEPRSRAVLLAGGGTAGHVNPLLAVAEELRRRDPDLRVVALGTAEGLEARLVPERGIELLLVPKVPLPRRPTADWFRLPRLLRSAVESAGHAIDEIGAQVVVGFGGYVSTPAYLAARARAVPVVVHEQNARPGLANRLGSRGAAAVAITFPGTRLPRAQVTGLPLRPEIAGLLAERAADPEGVRRRAAAELGFEADRVTLLVTGGSLGAVSVNTAVAAQAREVLATGAQVLHLTGAGKAESVRTAVRGVPGAERYHVREYLGEMEQALALADLVLCRSGAGTVSELAALGIPAVYVPLPVGNGEQRLNAQPVVAEGGGLLVADEDLTGDWIATHLLPLLAPEAAPEREAMGRAAASVGVPDGSRTSSRSWWRPRCWPRSSGRRRRSRPRRSVRRPRRRPVRAISGRTTSARRARGRTPPGRRRTRRTTTCRPSPRRRKTPLSVRAPGIARPPSRPGPWPRVPRPR